MVNTSTNTAATGRRTSLQCTSSSVGARSKPPPPVRRTSSITGTRPMMMLKSPTSSSYCGDDRSGADQLSFPLPAVPPGGFPSPSCPPRSVVDCGRQTSPSHAASSVRVSSAAPRRSLSSAYADLCQTLNDQLAASGGAGGGGRRRPPGDQQRRSSSAVDASSSGAASVARRQSAGAEDASTRATNNTLLMDIKRGVCLRPTATNDRSAPSIRRT